ncbi:MAG: hypothetical protein ABI411_11695 [Tahibacter sp.]
MGVRVIHHAGTLEGLRHALATNGEAMKQSIAEVNEEWEGNDAFTIPVASMDAVIDRQDFSDPHAGAILNMLINEHFPPVSDDWKIAAYIDFAERVDDPVLRTTLQRLYNESGMIACQQIHDALLGCGYLDHAQVVAADTGLVRYADHAEEWVRDFVASLRAAFALIIRDGTGDLFVVS